MIFAIFTVENERCKVKKYYTLFIKIGREITMKTKLLTMFLAVGMLSGCSSAFFLSSSGTGADDVYYNPNKDYSVTNAQPEINPVNSSDPRIAELQKKMNTSMAAAVADTTVASDTTNVEQKDENPFNAILASSYQDAQRRRDEAQADPAMSYSDLQDALWYASAYDPAFYNVIIYGSHVWVEPKYMSPGWYYPNPRLSFYGGFGYPYYSSNVYFGFGYSPFDYGFYPFTYGLGLSLYNPYYSWNSWGYGYYPYSYYDNDRINQRPYYYGRRSSGPSTFSSPTMLRRSTSNSMLRTTTVSPSQTTVRRPYTTTERYSGNVPAYSRKPVGNTSTPYTRPATATGRRTVNPNTNTYTPTYTRPSNGLRQNYNNNRPTTTTPSNNYYRRPASSNSSTTTYPRRNENRGTFSQPIPSGSVGNSNSSINSGSGNAGSRRRR